MARAAEGQATRPQANERRGPATSTAARELRFAATQLAIWAGLYGAYLFVRSLVIEKADDAYVHAAQLIRAERIAGLFHEPAIQQTVASVEELRVLFNLYYMLGFGPLLGLALVWLGLRHRHVYRELRTAMLASLGLASLFFVLYPTAPPRLVPNLGILDTVGLSGHDRGSFAGIHFDPTPLCRACTSAGASCLPSSSASASPPGSRSELCSCSTPR